MKILRTSLAKNKGFFDSTQLNKDEITLEVFNEAEEAIEVRYIEEEGDPWI